jgi:hypothetical protein
VVERVEWTIAAMQDLVDASRRARQVLAGMDDVLEDGIRRLRAGTPVPLVMRGMPASTQRQDVQDAIDRINTSRHRFRLHAIAACVDDGMTPREIADVWGISRQRIDQFIQEYRRSPPP